MKRIRLLFPLVLGLFALAACAPRASMEPEVQGPDFILEIHNPQAHDMNVRFSLGGAVRRWEIR